MKIDLKKTVWIGYFITITCMFLRQVDNFPIGQLSSLIKYTYIALMAVVNVLYIRPVRHNRAIALYWGLLFIQMILYTFVYTNPSIIDETYSHARELLWIYLIILFTVRFCYYTDSKNEFITASFFSMLLVLSWCYLTHLNGFAPIRHLFTLPQILMAEGRYGYSLGFSYYSFTGNCGCYGLILTAFMWQIKDEFSGLLKKYHKVILFYALVLFSVVLISAASRGEIISAGIFAFTIAFFEIRQKYLSGGVRRLIDIIMIILVIFVSVMLINATFATDVGANRSNNFANNMEIFKEYGDKWHGMGFAENFIFLGKGYGYDTGPCDVYYLYIFFSTGILGTILVFGSFAVMAVKVFWGKSSNDNSGVRTHEEIALMALLISIIFDMLYHPLWNSYYYLTCIFSSVLLLNRVYEAEKIFKRNVCVELE